MSLIVLASASGAPGVTTTALGLAVSWPRPVVLMDADPVGGSAVLAGHFRGGLEHPDAMVSLVMALREGRLAEVLPQVLVELPGSQASLLAGPRSAAQAGSLAELWSPLLAQLRLTETAGCDVLVDLGRLGMVGAALPVLAGADAAVLLTRSDLVSLSAARQWGLSWASAAESGTGPAVARCVVVGAGRPYSSREAAQVVGLPVVESIVWEEKAAAAINGAALVSGRAAARLGRSYESLGAGIRELLAVTDRGTAGVGA